MRMRENTPLGLSTPVTICGDLEFPKSIFLDTELLSGLKYDIITVWKSQGLP